MKTFGTVINHEFGGVEETGIITISDIYEAKTDRHIETLYTVESNSGLAFTRIIQNHVIL